MQIGDIRTLVAKRMGWNYIQRSGDIDLAIQGALEEYGANIDLPQLQAEKRQAISEGGNRVRRPDDYAKIISVEYKFTSGDNITRKHLDYKTKTSFDMLNSNSADSDSVTVKTDNIFIYTVSGDYLTVGIGHVARDGEIVIVYQRKPRFEDIRHIPNGMILVDGAESNLRPSDSPAGISARARFISEFRQESVASQAVMEQHDFAVPDANILWNQSDMEELL